MKESGMFWHVHHDLLLEYCHSYKERAEFIKRTKSPHEIPIRIKWFLPVEGKLPKEVVDKAKAFNAAQLQHVRLVNSVQFPSHTTLISIDNTERACNNTFLAYKFAIDKHKLELDTLHEKECPGCPWDGEYLYLIT